jgi:hypothetical protein
MNPQSVRYHDAGAHLPAGLLTDALATIGRVTALGHDVTTTRAAQIGDDTWPSRILLIDAASSRAHTLGQMLCFIEEHPAAGTCVIVSGDRQKLPA